MLDEPVIRESEIDDLRRVALVGLGVMGLALSWVWMIVVGAGYGDIPPMQAFLPPLVLCLTSGVSFVTKGVPQGLRNAVMMLGLSGTLFSAMLQHPSAIWIYYQASVIVIAGLLSGPLTSMGIAALLSGGIVALGRFSFLPWAELVPPVGLFWIMAAVASLASYSLHTALDWSLNSQRKAWEVANEVRQRRGELKSTLDSLTRTYTLLERANRELETARLEAEEAHQVKSRFVANISHEFRTPLNIIVGFAEMLCTVPESYGDFDWPPALREDILTIWRNAEHLLKMVDDVLDLAQIEVSRLPILTEPTDLALFLRDALVTAGALLRDSRLELRVSLPEGMPTLYLDRTRIRQVLLNLINNAVRPTSQGDIEVGARPAEEEIIVYVRDSGEGIPKDRLEAIFQEFEQADTSLRRPHQGAGLGLAICRHFVRLHGGRIWAESEMGVGSTFYFTIPFWEKVASAHLAQLRRTRAKGTRAPTESGAIVALCADSLASRFLERHLQRPILDAASVSDAIALVRAEHPRAVLVMPDAPSELSSGVDAARTILDAVAPLDLPVLTCRMPTERRASYLLRVPEVLIKPVLHQDIIAAIKRLTNHVRRVLAVDDDPDMLYLLQRIIANEWQEAEILTAASGKEALALVERRPSVILLDLLMPGMSGVEVLAQLRANPQTETIPVIVITARGPAEDLEELHKGELHLLKNQGFSAEELVHVVGAITQSLPPHYAPFAPTASPGIPGTAPA
jgi:signal transduction histidine kinase/CheY-like chemotaxis protein